MAMKDDSSAQIQSLKEDLSDLREEIGTLSNSVTENARQRLRSARKAAGSSISAASHSTRKLGRDGSAAIGRQVREYPTTSLLAAAGLGLVIGAALGRSSTHHRR